MWAKPLNFTETFTLTHHWLGQYSGQHQCPGIRWGSVEDILVFCMQHMLQFAWEITEITSIAPSFPSVDSLSVYEMLLVCENHCEVLLLSGTQSPSLPLFVSSEWSSSIMPAACLFHMPL